MDEIKTITKEDLKKKIDNQEDFVLLHTLGADSYSKIHLPGAVSVEGHADNLIEQVEKIAPDKNTEVVAYCTSFSCQLSPAVTRKLAEAGYVNATDFEGGLKDWAEGGYDFEGDEAEQVKESLLNG